MQLQINDLFRGHKMNFKIMCLISIFALSISTSFAEGNSDPLIENQQAVDSSGNPITIHHYPLSLINSTPLLTCHTNNLKKIMDNVKLPYTSSEQNFLLSVELKDDGQIKKIQTTGRNNNIIVIALKKAIYKSAPFSMPKDEDKIHLCNTLEFGFKSEMKLF